MEMKPEMMVVVVPSVLSIMGGMFTLLSYWMFPNTRSSAQVLAVYLSFAGMCYGGLTFFHSLIADSSAICSITAALATYFNNAALFTTVVVANYMRRIFFGLTGSSNSGGAMSLSIQDNAFIWVLPAILAALPFTTGHYGYNDDDIFCWIEGVGEGGNDHVRDTFSLLWQGLVVGIPAAIGICYNFWVYYSILKNVKAWKNTSGSNQVDLDSVMAVINRIRWYPIILAVVYILPLVHRIYQFASGENTSLLSALGAGSLKMQGFLDSILYGLSPTLLAEWRKIITSVRERRCCCCARQTGDGSTKHNRGWSDDSPILSRKFNAFMSSESSFRSSRESSAVIEVGGVF